MPRKEPICLPSQGRHSWLCGANARASWHDAGNAQSVQRSCGAPNYRGSRPTNVVANKQEKTKGKSACPTFRTKSDCVDCMSPDSFHAGTCKRTNAKETVFL